MRVTLWLTDSPACLVVGEHELSGNLERPLKAAGQKTPDVKPVPRSIRSIRSSIG